MTFSEQMDLALSGMKASHVAAVKSAFTTFQTAIASEQTSYGTGEQEETSLKEKLVTLALELSAQIR